MFLVPEYWEQGGSHAFWTIIIISLCKQFENGNGRKLMQLAVFIIV